MFGTIYKVYKLDNNDVHSTSRSLNFSRTQNPNLNDKRGLVENLALKNFDTEIIDEDKEANNFVSQQTKGNQISQHEHNYKVNVHVVNMTVKRVST